MMLLTLFIIYFLLLCFAITRLHFFKTPVRSAYMVLLFALHVAAGCIHNWIAFRFYPNHGDIWLFFEISIEMRQQLLAHPAQFFTDIFSTGGIFNITDTSKPMLGVQYQILLFINLLLNFFSFNNLYVNTLLFSFPVFAGTVALFKVFYSAYNKLLPAFCTLLLPSALFWTAVTYKDGLFYMAAGFFYYNLLQVNKTAFKKAILLLACTVMMVLTRANALITLFPALLFLLLSNKKLLKKGWASGITIAIVLITAVFINAIIPGGVLAAVCERQRDFQSLSGGSRLYLPALAPNAASFLSVLPRALINGFLQPLPGAGGKLIYTAFSAELLLIWFTVLLACGLLLKKKSTGLSSFDLSCLLFAVPGMIIIGYMVPFAGAIIRYRSIYLPFLLAPFINVICSYPAAGIQALNDWLKRNIMVIMETNIN